jgi:hypothetical protein
VGSVHRGRSEQRRHTGLRHHPRGQHHPQHYAFLISEEEFDAAYAQIRQRGIEHYADPQRKQPDAINHNDGGRGVYFMDPAGHAMELITVPYGGWTS